MAEDLRKASAAVNAEADATAALLNGGYLRLYSGSRPATADNPVTGQTLLAELRFGTPAFTKAVAGVVSANPLTQDTAADATGAATWYRALKSDGTTPVYDGSVGTSAANLVMNSVNIQVNAIVSVTAFSYTVPATA